MTKAIKDSAFGDIFATSGTGFARAGAKVKGTIRVL